MSFGLRNAAPEYQRAINITLDGSIGHGVLFAYIDDVIYAKTLEGHEVRIIKACAHISWAHN